MLSTVDITTTSGKTVDCIVIRQQGRAQTIQPTTSPQRAVGLGAWAGFAGFAASAARPGGRGTQPTGGRAQVTTRRSAWRTGVRALGAPSCRARSSCRCHRGGPKPVPTGRGLWHRPAARARLAAVSFRAGQTPRLRTGPRRVMLWAPDSAPETLGPSGHKAHLARTADPSGLRVGGGDGAQPMSRGLGLPTETWGHVSSSPATPRHQSWSPRAASAPHHVPALPRSQGPPCRPQPGASEAQQAAAQAHGRGRQGGGDGSRHTPGPPWPAARPPPRAHWSGEGGGCPLIRPFFVLLADAPRGVGGGRQAARAP